MLKKEKEAAPTFGGFSGFSNSEEGFKGFGGTSSSEFKGFGDTTGDGFKGFGDNEVQGGFKGFGNNDVKSGGFKGFGDTDDKGGFKGFGAGFGDDSAPTGPFDSSKFSGGIFGTKTEDKHLNHVPARSQINLYLLIVSLLYLILLSPSQVINHF